MNEEKLRLFGFPQVLAPDAPVDASSGYDRAKMMEAANRFLGPPLSNVASADYELFMLMANIIIEIGLPIKMPLYERSEGKTSRVRVMTNIDPEDFKDQDLAVSYDAIPQTVRAAQRESNLRLLELDVMSRQTFMVNEYDDREAEEDRIFTDKIALYARSKALELLQQIIDESAGQLKAQAAADANVPLGPPAPPPLVPPPGGAAPGEAARFASPETPMPGVGAPVVPPEQSVNGVPPSVGTGAGGGVP